MSNHAAPIRIAGVLLAVALLIGEIPHFPEVDALGRSRTQGHGAVLMLVGEGSATCDPDRLARGHCCIHPVASTDRPTITQSSYVAQADRHPLTQSRKLYALNAVFLI